MLEKRVQPKTSEFGLNGFRWNSLFQHSKGSKGILTKTSKFGCVKILSVFESRGRSFLKIFLVEFTLFLSFPLLFVVTVLICSFDLEIYLVVYRYITLAFIQRTTHAQ